MSAGLEPRCVELLDKTCITAINASLPANLSPFPLKPHLFFKLSGSNATIPAQQKSLISVLRSSGGRDLRLAHTDIEATQIWDIRKGLVYSLLALFPGAEVIGTDVCVPVSRLAGLIEQYKVDQERINGEIEVPQYGERKQLTSLVVGHVGDGNFHSIMYPPVHEDDADDSAFEKGNVELKKKAKELEEALVMNALALDGTASGEHGVGIHKIVLSHHPFVTDYIGIYGGGI
jgi:D-lactate dehydrogenase (cytochrome)